MGQTVCHCGNGVSRAFSTYFDGNSDDQALVVRVVRAVSRPSAGARASDFRVDDEITIVKLETVPGLEPLGQRYKDHIRRKWPCQYRFQAPRRSWQVAVRRFGFVCADEDYVLQMASRPEDRTLHNAELDIQDAVDAASYAARFSLYQQQHSGEGGADAVLHVKVAVPVACEVISSSYPSMIPVGAACTLVPYPCQEVVKFVFDGSEDFLELPQAFFHHAVFSSNGKEMVCDIQGTDDDDGSILLIDPCVLRSEPVQLSDLVGVAMPALTKPVAQVALAMDGPTPERFDDLHPRCFQLCKAFDPQRKSVKRNVGICGIGATCGLRRT